MFSNRNEKVLIDAAGRLVTGSVVIGTVLAVFGQKIGQILLKNMWKYFLTL